MYTGSVNPDECKSHRSVVVKWNPKLPHRSHFQGKRSFWPSCQSTPRKALISWGERPCFCYKRARISYVNDRKDCPRKYPAYIRWSADVKPCNRLVHIVWLQPVRETVEKKVDLRWAQECPEEKRRVEICWKREAERCPPSRAKEIDLTWVTRRGDCYTRDTIYCRSPPVKKTRQPRGKLLYMCCPHVSH